MQTLSEIKALLTEHNLSPRHALGQNFLIERTLITKLLDAAHASAGDLILEVGPGTGTLTEALLARGCTVLAVELDRGLAALLRERLGSHPAFTLIEGDCLAPGKRLNPELLTHLRAAPRFKLIANLPYQAATPLILNLLIEHPACTHLAVTIQREVADRLLARPGTKDMGILGLIAQSAATIEVIAKLPPECFWPRPEVTSAMALLTRLDHPAHADLRALAAFANEIFARRRKQLGSILGRDIPWPPGIRAEDRPENLDAPALARLMDAVHTHNSTKSKTPPHPETPSAE
ncbi:16S rRNA (adenine(1518)-N(6)/adenine(1519)-N(6))-dimethyltransferaseRsmA [soil metagenome]